MKIFGKKNGRNTKKLSRKMIFVISVILCLTAIIIAFSFDPRTEINTAEKKEIKRMVSVEEIKAGENSAKITLLGEAIPEWQTMIKSRVDGIITNISPKFRVGSNFKEGELLLEFENSQYEAMVADAEVRLSNAKNTLLVEENEAVEAIENWKRSGFKDQPESPLVFREPQLETARNEVKAAEAFLVKAKIDLDFTKIKAPFDGGIVERHVNLGESLMPGESIALFYSTDKIFVNVNIDQNQWKLLPDNLNSVSVKLVDTESGNSWNANIARAGNWLINVSRLRPLIIEVNNKKQRTPLIAGTFLNVELLGRSISNSIGVSESALTKGGLVWYVDQDSTLQSYRPKPHFYSEGSVYISLPSDTLKSIKVAVNPNSTFMNGFKVKPQLIREGE